MEPVSAILTAAGPIIALIGRAIAEGDFQKARQLREQAIAEFGPENMPVFDRVVAEEVGESAFNQISEDPSLRLAQTETADELKNVYDTSGMTAADVAAMQVAQDEVAQRASSDYADNAIRLAQMGQQGNPILSSALAAQSGQSAVGATANMARRAQMEARQRALQALLARGGLAGDIRGQDFGVAAKKAGAQDAINAFNAGQRTDAQRMNADIEGRRFDANMRLKAARNAARGVVAADREASGARTLQTAAGVGEAVSSAGGAFGDWQSKKDLEKLKKG